jgi:hypothetical protein
MIDARLLFGAAAMLLIWHTGALLSFLQKSDNSPPRFCRGGSMP